MNQNITDLNGYLFEQLERLNDEEMQGDALESEIKRAKSVSEVAGTVIKAGELALEAQRFVHDDRLDGDRGLPKMLISSE